MISWRQQLAHLLVERLSVLNNGGLTWVWQCERCKKDGEEETLTRMRGQQGETWNVVVVRSYLCNNCVCVWEEGREKEKPQRGFGSQPLEAPSAMMSWESSTKPAAAHRWLFANSTDFLVQNLRATCTPVF